MTDRKQPPEGYRVYEMGAKSVGHTGELRDHFTSGAVLISDGEHWTWDDAVAACEAHRDRIAAGAVAAVVELFRERQRQAEACMGREQITHREAANMIERTDLPEPAAALHRLLAAEQEKATSHWLDRLSRQDALIIAECRAVAGCGPDEHITEAVQRQVNAAKRSGAEGERKHLHDWALERGAMAERDGDDRSAGVWEAVADLLRMRDDGDLAECCALKDLLTAAMAEARRAALEEAAALLDDGRAPGIYDNGPAKLLRELARQGGEP